MNLKTKIKFILAFDFLAVLLLSLFIKNFKMALALLLAVVVIWLFIDKKDIRKLTPRECARFQGYDDNFILSDTLALSHLYKQIGNSVTVPVIEAILLNK